MSALLSWASPSTRTHSPETDACREAARRAWQVAAAVAAPQSQGRRIAEIGMLRDVTVDDRGRVHVQIAPAHASRGALEAIRIGLIEELTIAGYWHVDVEFLR